MRFSTLFASFASFALLTAASPISPFSTKRDLFLPADGTRYAGILSLQLLGRSALNATRTEEGECRESCAAWVEGTETCPQSPESVLLVCACEATSFARLEGCAECLGGQAESQAVVFATWCTSAGSLATNASSPLRSLSSPPTPSSGSSSPSSISVQSTATVISTSSTPAATASSINSAAGAGTSGSISSLLLSFLVPLVALL
ncbi:hypothetical protein JCM8547_003824 [Rhodosporidiobolus lusitaniae]